MDGQVFVEHKLGGGLVISLQVRIQERDLVDGQVPPAVVEALVMVLDQPYDFRAKIAALAALCSTIRDRPSSGGSGGSLPLQGSHKQLR